MGQSQWRSTLAHLKAVLTPLQAILLLRIAIAGSDSHDNGRLVCFQKPVWLVKHMQKMGGGPHTKSKKNIQSQLRRECPGFPSVSTSPKSGVQGTSTSLTSLAMSRVRTKGIMISTFFRPISPRTIFTALRVIDSWWRAMTMEAVCLGTCVCILSLLDIHVIRYMIWVIYLMNREVAWRLQLPHIPTE